MKNLYLFLMTALVLSFGLTTACDTPISPERFTSPETDKIDAQNPPGTRFITDSRDAGVIPTSPDMENSDEVWNIVEFKEDQTMPGSREKVGEFYNWKAR